MKKDPIRVAVTGAAGNIGYVDLKRSIYREYSRSYDEDRRRFASGGALAQRIDWALEGMDPGQRLLDLGCGSGELLSDAAARAGGDGLLVGMDLTPEMLALARRRIGRSAGLLPGLLQGNVLNGLPFGDRLQHISAAQRRGGRRARKVHSVATHESRLFALKPSGAGNSDMRPCSGQSRHSAALLVVRDGRRVTDERRPSHRRPARISQKSHNARRRRRRRTHANQHSLQHRHHPSLHRRRHRRRHWWRDFRGK